MAKLTGQSENKVRKIYRSIIENECIPLSEVPPDIQNRYVNEYLLRDKIIDFSFLSAIKDYDCAKPLQSTEVKELFTEMQMLREAHKISNTYSAVGTKTIHLRQLAEKYKVSYSTLARRSQKYMNNTSLSRALLHDGASEDTIDRYRKCCYLCRDLIISKHELSGKISGAKIFRDIRDSKP